MFFGVIFSIYVLNHTTPTGRFYYLTELEEIEFLGYFSCYDTTFEDTRYINFINRSCKKYEINFYCDLYCNSLETVLNLSFKPLILKDENENLICYCSTSKIFCNNWGLSEIDFIFDRLLKKSLEEKY